MSDSEKKQELGGLARSIGSLFSDPPPGERSAAEPEPPGSETDAAAQSSPPEVEPVGVVPPPPPRPEPQPMEAGPPPFPELEPMEAGPPPLPELEPIEAGPPPLPETVPAEASPPPLLQPIEAEAPATGGAAEDRSSAWPEPAEPLPQAEAASVASSEAEPEALFVAVEAYLDGATTGGDEVRDLAAGAREARHYDTVAAAAERLALEGSRRADAASLSLARELLTPVVLGRFVQRLGRARDEALRADYHEMCRALGSTVAGAIRDELAETDDLTARRGYVAAMIAMGEEARDVVEGMVEDENRFLARNAVFILGETGGDRARDLVLTALWNSDPRVRREALAAAAKLDIEEAAPQVMEALEDPHPKVRMAAVRAAGQLRLERAVRSLSAELEERYDAEEVLPLLHALGQIGDPGAVSAIEKHAVRDRFGPPRTEVRIAAYEALNLIGTPHARRLVNQARDDRDPEVKAAALQLLHLS